MTLIHGCGISRELPPSIGRVVQVPAASTARDALTVLTPANGKAF